MDMGEEGMAQRPRGLSAMMPVGLPGAGPRGMEAVVELPQ